MVIKWIYLHGHLWKGGDQLRGLIIRGVRVNISTQTISQMLYGPEFLQPANTLRIDFCIVEMQKIKRKQIRTDDKFIYF